MLLFNLLTQASNSNGGGDTPPNYFMWIFVGVFVVLLVVMMFTSNRANKKRQKEAEEKLNNMRVGDRVKTIGGICGIVVEINDDENTFVLETGVGNKGSFVKFDKVAVYQTSHPEDAVTAEPEKEEVKEESVTENTTEETVEETTAEEVNVENAEQEQTQE